MSEAHAHVHAHRAEPRRGAQVEPLSSPGIVSFSGVDSELDAQVELMRARSAESRAVARYLAESAARSRRRFGWTAAIISAFLVGTGGAFLVLRIRLPEFSTISTGASVLFAAGAASVSLFSLWSERRTRRTQDRLQALVEQYTKSTQFAKRAASTESSGREDDVA
jgi:hypothetical protein